MKRRVEGSSFSEILCVGLGFLTARVLLWPNELQSLIRRATRAGLFRGHFLPVDVPPSLI